MLLEVTVLYTLYKALNRSALSHLPSVSKVIKNHFRGNYISSPPYRFGGQSMGLLLHRSAMVRGRPLTDEWVETKIKTRKSLCNSEWKKVKLVPKLIGSSLSPQFSWIIVKWDIWSPFNLAHPIPFKDGGWMTYFDAHKWADSKASWVSSLLPHWIPFWTTGQAPYWECFFLFYRIRGYWTARDSTVIKMALKEKEKGSPPTL